MRRRILSRLCPNVLRMWSLVDSLPDMLYMWSAQGYPAILGNFIRNQSGSTVKYNLGSRRRSLKECSSDFKLSSDLCKWNFFSCVTEIAPSSGTRLRSNPLHPQDYGPTRITWCCSSATRWSTQALVPSTTHNRQLEVNWKNCRTKEKVL